MQSGKTMHVSRLIVAVAALVFSGGAFADGKMFVRETVPPSIPYQRALILFKDGTETLVLQSKYELPADAKAETVGWVVPTPSVPELGTMPADEAERLFGSLSMSTSPRVTRVSHIVLPIVWAVFTLTWVVVALGAMASDVRRRFPWFERNRRRISHAGLVGAVVSVLSCCIWFPTLGLAKGSRGVEIVSEQSVGIFGVKVVRASNSEAMISWLNEHQFKFGDVDRNCIDAYIAQDWCFVVAIIDPSNVVDQNAAVYNGLAAPLVMRFESAHPTYPVALTATAGHDTEILLYTFGDTKQSCQGRMTLRAAARAEGSTLWSALEHVTPPSLMEGWDTEQVYSLCKFKDTLTPSQMVQDIVFMTDADATTYREHIVKW